MNRRQLLGLGAGALGLALMGQMAFAERRKTRPGQGFELALSDEEWRKRLTPAQYRILRDHGTERPFTSALLAEKRSGTYVCAGCALPLYRSADKYDSGTGWPSFTRDIAGNVLTERDLSYGMIRTEVLCRRCGGHLGHVFDDGPPPTGKRHCINGVALEFVPART